VGEPAERAGEYRQSLRRDFAADLEFGSRLAKRLFLGRFLFGSVPERMVQFTRRSPRFSAIIQDLFAGKQPYLGLKRRLLQNLNGSLYDVSMSLGSAGWCPAKQARMFHSHGIPNRKSCSAGRRRPFRAASIRRCGRTGAWAGTRCSLRAVKGPTSSMWMATSTSITWVLGTAPAGASASGYCGGTGGRAGHRTSFGAPTEQEVELAEAIRDAVPSIEMVRLVNSAPEPPCRPSAWRAGLPGGT